MRLFTATHIPAGFALTAPLSTHRRAGRAAVRTGSSFATSRPTAGTPVVPAGAASMAPIASSALPLAATATAASDSTITSAANDPRYFTAAQDAKVRILRRDVGDRARMVLSGRMADVCAALERMSRAEALSCAH